MKCNEVRERLPSFLDGGLAPEAEVGVARHLVECAGCRDDEVLLMGSWEMLGAWGDVEPSEGLTDRIMGQVRAEQAKVVPLTRSPRWHVAANWRRTAAGLAAAVLVACMLLLTNTTSVVRDGPVVDEMVSTWDAGSEVVVFEGMPQYVASSADSVVVPSILYDPSDPRHRGTEDDMLEEIIADQNG